MWSSPISNSPPPSPKKNNYNPNTMALWLQVLIKPENSQLKNTLRDPAIPTRTEKARCCSHQTADQRAHGAQHLQALELQRQVFVGDPESWFSQRISEEKTQKLESFNSTDWSKFGSSDQQDKGKHCWFDKLFWGKGQNFRAIPLLEIFQVHFSDLSIYIYIQYITVYIYNYIYSIYICDVLPFSSIFLSRARLKQPQDKPIGHVLSEAQVSQPNTA